MAKNFGVILIGMPFLYQSGDIDFHMKMASLGLFRGNSLRCGLKNKVIWANRYEYFLTDCDSIDEFVEKYDLTPTYTEEDFINEIKKHLEEK